LNIIEAPRPQGGASRKGNFVHIVSLDPAYKVGLAGHVPVKTQSSKLKTEFFLVKRYPKMRMDAKEKIKKPSKEHFEGTGVLMQSRNGRRVL
jgi:hypothetical protein